jgi:hypothetical protein
LVTRSGLKLDIQVRGSQECCIPPNYVRVHSQGPAPGKRLYHQRVHRRVANGPLQGQFTRRVFFSLSSRAGTARTSAVTATPNAPDGWHSAGADALNHLRRGSIASEPLKGDDGLRREMSEPAGQGRGGPKAASSGGRSGPLSRGSYVGNDATRE